MIMIVSSAPSTIESCTSASDSRMRRESSRMTVMLTSARQLRSSSPTAARTASATATVFDAGDLEHVERHGAAVPLASAISAAVRRSSAPSTTVATSPMRIGDAVAHGDRDVGERARVDDAAGDADEPLGGAALDAARGHFLILALRAPA